MKNVKDLTPEELIKALRVCANGDGEDCVNCPACPNPGTDCCAELLTAAADALENA